MDRSAWKLRGKHFSQILVHAFDLRNILYVNRCPMDECSKTAALDFTSFGYMFIFTGAAWNEPYWDEDSLRILAAGDVSVFHGLLLERHRKLPSRLKK